jgi:uncharacterized membrane protein YbhN (UPF0104 family)
VKRRTRKRALRWIGWAGEIALLGGAVWVLHHQLRNVSLHEIVVELRSLPAHRVGMSLVLTAAGYLVFAGYDLVALRYLDRSLPLRRVVVSSFIGSALANNAPLSFLVGGSVRYRLYSSSGLSSKDTTALVLLNVLTYSLGLATAAALAFTLEPESVPHVLHLPFQSTRPLGWAAVAGIVAYLIWSAWRTPLRVGHWSLAPLPLPTSLLQIAVSLADWILSGAALYVLLPGTHPLSYFAFFGPFILGQIAALIAQVPGGLGVFEAVMLVTLVPPFSPAGVFGALLAYRVIYFFLPLVLAAVVLGAREVVRLQRIRA